MPLHVSPTQAVPTNDTAFDVTLTTAGTAQDLIVAPAGEKIRSFELVNNGPGNAYIKGNVTATIANGVKVKNNDTYDKDFIALDKLSFIGEAGKKPNVSGTAWSS